MRWRIKVFNQIIDDAYCMSMVNYARFNPIFIIY